VHRIGVFQYRLFIALLVLESDFVRPQLLRDIERLTYWLELQHCINVFSLDYSVYLNTEPFYSHDATITQMDGLHPIDSLGALFF
jgi:hypothetical protein